MPSLLDFIFPKRCVSCGRVGAYICKGCFEKIEYIEHPVCPVCQRQAIGGKVHPGCQKRYGLDGLIVACRYRGPVKIAVAKVKYRWVFDMAKVLVELLASCLWKFDIPQNYILVPVPLHARRKNWRGFNQAELLVEILAKKFGVKYADLLIRNRETKTQVGLSRDDRKKNVKGAFSLYPSGQEERKPFDFVASRRDSAQGKIIAEVKDQDIILVDDVYTSGATMAEAARVLKRAGAKSVWGMAVALG